MPQWTQVVIGAAAFVGAVTFIWTGILRPLIRLGAETTSLEDRIAALERRLEELEP